MRSVVEANYGMHLAFFSVALVRLNYVMGKVPSMHWPMLIGHSRVSVWCIVYRISQCNVGVGMWLNDPSCWYRCR